jgi:hypothetical protein
MSIYLQVGLDMATTYVMFRKEDIQDETECYVRSFRVNPLHCSCAMSWIRGLGRDSKDVSSTDSNQEITDCNAFSFFVPMIINASAVLTLMVCSSG